jgi:hypothetical protein
MDLFGDIMKKINTSRKSKAFAYTITGNVTTVKHTPSLLYNMEGSDVFTKTVMLASYLFYLLNEENRYISYKQLLPHLY